jgi:hypothetical protein
MWVFGFQFSVFGAACSLATHHSYLMASTGSIRAACQEG